MWKLLRGQLRFMNQTFEVQGMTSQGERLDAVREFEGIPIHAVKMTRRLSPLIDLLAIWRAFCFFRKTNPTIVHTHTPKAGMVGMIAARLAGVPIRMHTVAGLPVETKKGLMRKILLWTEKLTYMCAHRVYPNSKGMADFIQQNSLCSATKLKIIANGSTNGVDLDHFKLSPELKSKGMEIRTRLGLAESDVLFCFVGRMVPDKGVEELLWATERLASENTTIHLVLLGRYEKLHPISEDAKSALKHPQIHYEGYQDEVRPYLAASDVFVLPTYREGLPNVLLQAGAMGLPVIATQINGCTDIVCDYQNGVLIPPQDKDALYGAISQLLMDKQLRSKIASVSRQMIQDRYEQTRVWNELRREYLQLISKLNTG